MTEWRACVGYEGRYEVSDAGNVRNARNGRLRKQRLNFRGYPEVFIGKKTWKVHGGAGNRGPADTLIIAATLTAAHLAVCSATARSPVSTEGK